MNPDGTGWRFGYNPLIQWCRRGSPGAFWWWLFYFNQFYHRRGQRCTYLRVCGFEVEHIHWYGK